MGLVFLTTARQFSIQFGLQTVQAMNVSVRLLEQTFNFPQILFPVHSLVNSKACLEKKCTAVRETRRTNTKVLSKRRDQLCAQCQMCPCARNDCLNSITLLRWSGGSCAICSSLSSITCRISSAFSRSSVLIPDACVDGATGACAPPAAGRVVDGPWRKRGVSSNNQMHSKTNRRQRRTSTRVPMQHCHGHLRIENSHDNLRLQ